MERSKTLDILRALAIFLVLGRHLVISKIYINKFFTMILEGLVRGGWVGVDLFFVISGFLISGLLFKEYNKYGFISFKNFFIRRGFKIYPAYYTLIAVTLGVLFFKRQPVDIKSVVSSVFFVQNYTSAFLFRWIHTWSLAVEEHFYIILPLLLIWLTRINKFNKNPFKSIPVITLFISLICLVARFFTGIIAPYSTYTHQFPSHLRIDSLFFGVLISYFYHYHPDKFNRVSKRYKFLFLFTGAALLLPAFLFDQESYFFMPTVGFTMFYLGSGLILAAVASDELRPNMFVKGTAYVGSHSYSIYLWHLPVALWLLPYMKGLMTGYWNWVFNVIVYVGGSIAIGIIMANIVEFPMLKIRDRFYPSRTKSPL